MPDTYVIGPSIGVARLGNSQSGFYVEPEAIGGLPVECDPRAMYNPGRYSSRNSKTARVRLNDRPHGFGFSASPMTETPLR